MRRKIWMSWLPIAGIFAFVVLYFCAASLYPGGSYFDKTSLGYSHQSNYWCDLLEAVSYGGHANNGRPFAMLATIVLPLSLIAFWLQVPVLFRVVIGPAWIVPVSGTISMIVATLVFTKLHNLVINVAFISGLLAFGITTLCLARSRHGPLVALAVVALSLAVIDWLMWEIRLYLPATPLVQKMAYASFFIWVIATSHQIRRALELNP